MYCILVIDFQVIQSVQVHFMLFQSNPFLFLSILQPEQTLTSIVIYPLYHHVTGTIHQGEINWLLSTNGRRPQAQEKAFNIFHPFISQVLEKLLVLGCASAAQYHTKLVFLFFSCLITIQSYWILDWIRTSVQIWGRWCTLYWMVVSAILKPSAAKQQPLCFISYTLAWKILN